MHVSFSSNAHVCVCVCVCLGACVSRCTLLSIDKLEFLHLLRHKNAIKSVLDSAEAYAGVNSAIDGGGGTGAAGEGAGGQDGGGRPPPPQGDYVPLAASTKSLRLLVSRATKKRQVTDD